MLIIFDLDDTLIDTSGSITLFQMKRCLIGLVKKGLDLGDFQLAYQELLTLNESALSSKEAIQNFLEKRKAPISFFKNAKEAMKQSLPKDFFIKTTPFAKEMLKHFSKKCPLALVTGGDKTFQLEKMEKAGIDSAFFSRIIVSEDLPKGPFYEGIIEDFSVPFEEVFVCGDRVQVDLKPAFDLGCKTVQLRWGRGKKTQEVSWVNYVIHDLKELKEIVQV